MVSQNMYCPILIDEKLYDIDNNGLIKPFGSDNNSVFHNGPCDAIKYYNPILCGTISLTRNGKIYSSGFNGTLCLGAKDMLNQLKSHEVVFPKGIKMVATYGHSLFLDIDGDVYVCGYNSQSCIEKDDGGLMKFFILPTKISLPEPIISVCCGGGWSLFLGQSGKVYIRGLGLQLLKKDGETLVEVCKNGETIELRNDIIQISAWSDEAVLVDINGDCIVLKGGYRTDEPAKINLKDPIIKAISRCGKIIALTSSGEIYAVKHAYSDEKIGVPQLISGVIKVKDFIYNPLKNFLVVLDIDNHLYLSNYENLVLDNQDVSNSSNHWRKIEIPIPGIISLNHLETTDRFKNTKRA